MSESNAESSDRDGESSDKLIETLYVGLKEMAHRQLARGARQTLNTTELVHELYLRVIESKELKFEYPEKFFAYAARAMRHLLIDRARARMRQKAGGEWVMVHLTTNEDLLPAIECAEQALAIEEALKQLERVDKRAATVVELRWFAGVAPEEIARILQLTRRTVDRDWRFAAAFLQAALG